MTASEASAHNFFKQIGLFQKNRNLHNAPGMGSGRSFLATEYSPVKYSGLSSRRPGSESRPEHHNTLQMTDYAFSVIRF